MNFGMGAMKKALRFRDSSCEKTILLALFSWLFSGEFILTKGMDVKMYSPLSYCKLLTWPNCTERQIVWFIQTSSKVPNRVQ